MMDEPVLWAGLTGMDRLLQGIEDEAGLRFWIFRDGLYESELADEEGEPVPVKWFVHGLFA